MKSLTLGALSASVLLVSAPAFALGGLPEDIKPGECYTKVFVPAVYGNDTKKIVVKEGSKSWQVIPPEHETITERVLKQEATFEFVVEEPVYEERVERVLVSPATSSWKLVKDDPIFAVLAEQGEVETRIDSRTGETLCRISEPARYRDITRKVLVRDARISRREIPAQYQTVTKKVLRREASKKLVEIEPVYDTVEVRKLTSAASIRWASVLCETNMTAGTVQDIQIALRDRGYYPGPIDGIIGKDTILGIKKFQTENGLSQGGITMETLEKLGVVLGK